MKLHLGAGDKYWPGWVNVDLHGDQDVNCPAHELPFADGVASEAQAIHLLEHLPRLQAPAAVEEWHRVLAPGGRLVLELPCLDKMARLIVAGEPNLRLTLLGIFGDPRDPRPGMMHQWAYTIDEVERLLRDVGFAEVAIEPPRFHIPARDMRAIARKGD